MSGRVVLVIEDEALNRKLLRTLLTLGGFTVLEAEDAESGIRLARESLPDCILMDIRLPGMDGLEATRVIKTDPRLRSVPVVAVTGASTDGEERKALDAGCDGYITKPIDTRAFLDNIRRFLHRTRQASLAGEARELPAARVLVVDDEEQVRRLFTSLLAKDGYEVTEAAGGAEALAKAHAQTPDLVLLDAVLPDIHGNEVARRLKGSLGTLDVPIIMVTGHADREARLSGLESGADEFLAKPVDPVELLVRIKSMIRLKRFQDRLAERGGTEESTGSPAESGGGEAPAPAGADVSPTVVVAAERDEDSVRRVQGALEGAGFRVTRAHNGEETLAAVTQRGVNVLLLDTRLPRANPLELCRFLKGEDGTRNIQIVVVSPSSDAGSRVAALESGADDYLSLPLDAGELTVRVKQHSKRKAMLEALQARYRSAMNAAAHDGLTGLANNVTFKRLLGVELKRAHRHALPAVLLLLDIDDFKRLNDTRGHLMGDLVLGEVAQILKAGIRDIDIAGRYGGEEFAVLLPHTDAAGALVVAERLRAAVAGRRFLVEVSPGGQTVTVSVGAAFFPSDATTPEDLIMKADARLYEAKGGGKNRVSAGDGPPPASAS